MGNEKDKEWLLLHSVQMQCWDKKASVVFVYGNFVYKSDGTELNTTSTPVLARFHDFMDMFISLNILVDYLCELK